MTPIQIQCSQDEEGHAFLLQVVSLEKSLHKVEFLEVLEGWLEAMKKQHAEEIKEFLDLKSSGKLVSMIQWKNKT